MSTRRKTTSARTKLGLSQEKYMTYLLVGRGVLAMYESNNTRNLPFAAGMRHGAIEVCLAKPETATATRETELQQEGAAVQVLTKRRTECLYLVTNAQAQLARMQEWYQQCLNRVRVGAAAPAILLEIFPQNDRYEEDKECLESFGRTGKYDMEECGIGQQQLLQLKIEALQFEADRIGQMLEG